MEGKIEVILENIKARRERRMFVLAGNLDKSLDLLKEIVERYRKVAEKRKAEVCLVMQGENRELRELEGFFKKDNFQRYEYKQSEFLLGTSWDILILDLLQGIMPNDLGRLIGIVRGNGLIFLILPKLEKFEKMVTKFHQKILVPPFGKEDLRFVFNRWFVKKLKKHRGIFIFEDGKVVYWSEEPKAGKGGEEEKLIIPKNTYFPRESYLLCKTQDQIYALKSLEEFFRGREKVFVLTSHRGRGKSSLLGIAIASLLFKEKHKVLVSAPQKTNVSELFKFFNLLSEKFGIKKPLEYVKPFDLRRVKADLLVIDEASAIPVPLLFSALKNCKKVIYATTIHGYEGCGRSFNIRFLGELREQGIKIREVEMREPIRYSEQDPIEKWLFDVLLLDAEPPSVSESEVNLKKTRFKELDIKKLAFENEKKLREYFGIFVTAHYRNNPNDFGIICEAPHHKIFSLDNEKGITLCALQIAMEGNLSQEYCRKMLRVEEFSGHLIPDRFIKHYREPGFGKLKGLRIIRIATHPLLIRKGIGSRALEELENYAKEKGYDWIGASFGATYPLLSFWLKNGYLPLHISPAKNPSTGEYSVIVAKSLSKEGKKYLDLFGKEFLIKFVDSLSYPYNVLETEIAWLILKNLKDFEYKPTLTQIQKKRIEAYLDEILTFETCRDCLYELAKYYFLGKERYLREREELILIAKCLQGKPWRSLKNIIKAKSTLYAIQELRNSLRKVYSTLLSP